MKPKHAAIAAGLLFMWHIVLIIIVLLLVAGLVSAVCSNVES